MASFDWYQGTIPQPVNDVLECLSLLAPDMQLTHRKGMHGFAVSAVLGTPSEGSIAQVWYGGSHAHPHAVLSGHWANEGARLIRASFPEHTVSRLDVKEDYFDAGAFDRIQASALEVARANRVVVGTAGDHLLTMKGRTLYLGSPKSAIRTRLYDKRAEILSKLPQGVGQSLERARAFSDQGFSRETFPDHWTRLESQIKPVTKEAKARMASIEPTAALGAAAWLRSLWEAVEGLKLTPVQIGRGYRVSDEERRMAWMIRLYGRTLSRMKEELGSWACVGLQLGHEVEEAQKAERKRHGSH